jgi:hypothetical protein
MKQNTFITEDYDNIHLEHKGERCHLELFQTLAHHKHSNPVRQEEM